ncbi:hypothetical protein ZWY2020_035302 [Hordeum vulgare]|nr:hypothetical protein ZWY2020_035294 [Hordeum vulgare]KAI4995399.1 hypothetical protein ZWY2020_035302 [Hordeum vulgare]
MLQAGSERAARLWVPGMSPVAVAPDGAGASAREREIARRREEMLGMLRDLPEADYELSLTDLVDKTAAAANGAVAPLPCERKEASPSPSPLGLAERSASAEQQPAQTAVRTTEKRGSARRRGDGGSGLRSSSDGVLLNFYMPRSFTRSFTAPRPARTPSFSNSGRAACACAVAPDDCNKRERDGDTVRCWPLPWDRRWRKSSRRRQDAAAATSGELSAMLTEADHSDPADKV